LADPFQAVITIFGIWEEHPSFQTAPGLLANVDVSRLWKCFAVVLWKCFSLALSHILARHFSIYARPVPSFKDHGPRTLPIWLPYPGIKFNPVPHRDHDLIKHNDYSLLSDSVWCLGADLGANGFLCDQI
jgi:hypothetical protein